MKAAVVSNAKAKYLMRAPAVAGGFVAVEDELSREEIQEFALDGGIWHWALLPSSHQEDAGVRLISMERLREAISERASSTRAAVERFPEIFEEAADAWENMLERIDQNQAASALAPGMKRGAS